MTHWRRVAKKKKKKKKKKIKPVCVNERGKLPPPPLLKNNFKDFALFVNFREGNMWSVYKEDGRHSARCSL